MPCASSRRSRESPSQPGKVKWALAGRAALRCRVAAEDRVRHRRTDRVDQVVAQGADLAGEPLALLGGEAAGDREGGDGGDVEGAGADVAFLAAAVQDRYGAVLAAQEQRADAVGAADLVAGNRHRGEPGGSEVDRELTDRLDRVGVQRHVELGGHVGEFTDRHDRADLVVGPHHAGEGYVGGVAGDGLAQRLRMDAAVGVDRQVLDRGALVLAEPVDGVEDRVVLDGAGQDPGAGRVGVAAGPVQALDGEVVGLRAAGGEDHLAGAGAEGFGEGLAGLLDGAPCAAAGRVEGGGVAGDAQVRGECLDCLGKHRGGRGVVEVSHGAADSTGAVPPGLRSRLASWPAVHAAVGHRVRGATQRLHDIVSSAAMNAARTNRSATPSRGRGGPGRGGRCRATGRRSPGRWPSGRGRR